MPIDDEEQAVLAAARRGFSPTADDETRVRMGTLAAIHSAVNPGSPSGWHEKTTPGSTTTGVHVAKVGAWVPQLVAASAIAVIAAGGGYWYGFQAGKRQATPLRSPVVSISPTPAPQHANPEVSNAAASTNASPTEVTNPAAPSRHSPPAPSGTNGAPVDTLEEEVRGMRRIERLLRAQNPLYALALLDDMDRAIPGGHLSEERSAARVIAGCQTDAANAGRQASDFAKRHPVSVYAERIAQACRGAGAADERMKTPPETHDPKETDK